MPKRTKINRDKIEPLRKVEYKDFVLFTALPKSIKDKEYGYHTDKGFAKQNGLAPNTLMEWHRAQSFWDDVSAQQREWAKGRTPNIILSLAEKAEKTGDAAEAKLWFQIFENFREKSDSTVSVAKETLQAIQESMRTLIGQEKDKKKGR